MINTFTQTMVVCFSILYYLQCYLCTRAYHMPHFPLAHCVFTYDKSTANHLENLTITLLINVTIAKNLDWVHAITQIFYSQIEILNTYILNMWFVARLRKETEEIKISLSVLQICVCRNVNKYFFLNFVTFSVLFWYVRNIQLV